MITNGIKSANQVQFQNQNGEPTVPVIGSKGGMLVEMADGSSVAVKEETTLASAVVSVTSEATQVPVNSKVTSIAIGNYSDEANVTVTAGNIGYVVGPNVAVDLPINKDVTNVSIVATAEAKVQYVIKGIESEE